ncbi:MAG TPA: TorF family putative porin [Candidatus Sulfotelmatobacter sp.]|nr:TorF family putative porin [Candidatus Sulfotelmatobacter sp.]
MKRLVIFLVVGWLGCLVVSCNAAIMDLNAAYVSKYFWRGQDLNNGQPALQPGATFYLGNSGFSLGLWGSYNLGGSYANALAGGYVERQLTEVDYTLTYASAFSDSWNYSLYYSQYTYPPGQSVRTGELFLALTGNGLPFKPTLTLSYDNDQGKGSYVSLAGKNSFAAGPQKIDCSLTAGYDNGQFGVKPGFSDATFSLSTAFLGNGATFTPTLNYTVVGKDTRPHSENTFWFSLNIASSL